MKLSNVLKVIQIISATCGMAFATSNNKVLLSPYKDVTTNMDWNTNIMGTSVTGTQMPLTKALPAGLKVVTLAFATGECGSENWGGVPASAFATANIPALNAAKISYILGTGGAAGSFTCASDAGFVAFVNRYMSAGLVGIDFDIEAGQSQSDIENLVARVKMAQTKWPSLRYSFTLATFGGPQASPILGDMGVSVVQAIKRIGLSNNYLINLMTMDYGSPSPYVCEVVNGLCDMGKSAITAARLLNSQFAIPYSQIELTPMIGGNDVTNEIFTVKDMNTISTFALQNGLAGIHFWSLDRDRDCPPGAAGDTCNSYGQAGTLGFTKGFISALNGGYVPSPNPNPNPSPNPNPNPSPNPNPNPKPTNGPCPCSDYGKYSSDSKYVCAYIQAYPPVCQYIKV